MRGFKMIILFCVVFMLFGSLALFAEKEGKEGGKGDQIVMGALWQNMANEFLK